ncbi:MAG: cation transporter [Lentisphaeria bacterium]|nr:cation transporter [Lentisphaeria bacterium]
MTGLLIHLFVRHPGRISDQHVREAYGVLGGAVGILCNLLLFAVKLSAGLLTGSIAVTADAVNNLSDAGSSVIALFGARLAAKPADDQHPFGHGRMEYVAGLVVAVIIIAVGLDFFKSSVERIIEPAEVRLSVLLFALAACSIPVKLWMFFFYRTLAKRIDSPVLRATAFDSLSDILTTSVVLISLYTSTLTAFPVDGIAGVLVAAMVVVGGVKVVRDTINPLLGEAPDPELVSKLLAKVLENPDICGIHDLMMHNYGPGRYFATAHAEVNSDADPVRIHDSLEDTERRVARALPVRLVLHCDPFEKDDPEYKKWRLAAVGAAHAFDARFQVYDFRVIRADGCLLLRFDLLIPRDCPYKPAELREMFRKELGSSGEPVKVVIRVEHAFI